jgi:hypothetical protein
MSHSQSSSLAASIISGRKMPRVLILNHTTKPPRKIRPKPNPRGAGVLPVSVPPASPARIRNASSPLSSKLATSSKRQPIAHVLPPLAKMSNSPIAFEATSGPPTLTCCTRSSARCLPETIPAPFPCVANGVVVVLAGLRRLHLHLLAADPRDLQSGLFSDRRDEPALHRLRWLELAVSIRRVSGSRLSLRDETGLPPQTRP